MMPVSRKQAAEIEYRKRIEKESLRREAEKDLSVFTRQAWQVIEPGTDFIGNWHIDLIGEYMHAVARGEIKRLIINMPPRHIKSILITVCFPAWVWIEQPHKRFIKVSYSDALSKKHNIMARDVIRSPWYQGNWGNRFKLKDDVNRQSQFENDAYGQMFSTSTGGALTGEGGDVIILDDPQNPQMANSDAERQATINFFQNTLQSRLNNQKEGAIILVMQRLHENDLTGYILGEGLGYELLRLPAIAEKKSVVTFPISGRTVFRDEGDLLNPQRFDAGVLAGLKKSMGSIQFAGQFQQTPVPAEGIIFQRDWLKSRFKKAAMPHQNMIVQSWDLAFTKSEGSAKCAGFIMGRSGGNVYILDLINRKMTFTESVQAVRQLTLRWPKARAKVVENKANGPAIVDLLKKEIPGMVEFNPKGSKEERAISVTPYFEAGNVWFPDSAEAPWVNDLINDLLSFPRGTYKDTVDALVQGILYLMDKPAMTGPPKKNNLYRTSYWVAS
jgi:predicted phage terminase large subunit-like protein